MKPSLKPTIFIPVFRLEPPKITWYDKQGLHTKLVIASLVC